MSFVFPENGPARVYRFRPASEMPSGDVISMLDAKTNVLRVNRDLFEMLSPPDQRLVLRTGEQVLVRQII